MESAEAILESLRDACRDTSVATALSSVDAHFSLWNPVDICGVGRLVVPWNRQPVVVSETAFAVRLLDQDGKLREAGVTVTRYPYGFRYAMAAPPFTVEGDTAFADSDTVTTVLNITNGGPERATPVLSIAGSSTADDRRRSVEPAGRSGFLVHCNAARMDVRDPAESVDVYYAVTCSLGLEPDRTPAPAADAGRPEQPQALSYRFVARAHELEPGAHMTVCVVLSLSIMNPRWCVHHAREVLRRMRDAQSSMRRLRLREAELLSRMPDPAGQERDLAWLMRRCGLVLLMNSYGPFRYRPMRRESTFGNRTGIFPNRGVFTGFWIEDTSLHVMGLRDWLPELARTQLMVNLSAQLPDGCIPMFPTIRCPLMRRETQNPILSWACWCLYSSTRDRGFLRTAYPILSRYHRWWFRERDRDGDGLCEFACGGESGNDNNPRWDTRDGRQEVGAQDIEAVDLSSYLIVDARCLAAMAGVLGRRREAEAWSREADELGQKVLRFMYDPQENLFHDIWYDTHEPRTILTPMSFMPLWAGVPLERSRAREMIESRLLNPRLLFGEYPFPSVAYNEPSYDPGGFWRGPTWLTHAYFMLQVLEAHGYRSQADEAIRRLLAMVRRAPYIAEWYNSSTGDGSRSVQEYSWTAALLIAIILGGHRDPVVPEVRESVEPAGA